MGKRTDFSLRYYSLESDWFNNNIALKRAIHKEGTICYAVYCAIRDMIFKRAHYLLFINIEDVVYEVAAELCAEDEEVYKAINVLVNYGLYDKKLFKEHVLTSIDLQEIYYSCRRKNAQKHIDKYWLLDKTTMDGIDAFSNKCRDAYYRSQENKVGVKGDNLDVNGDNVDVDGLGVNDKADDLLEEGIEPSFIPQTTSNEIKENERKREEITIDRQSKGEESPNSYTQYLISCGIIDMNDDIKGYNAMLFKLERTYDHTDLYNALRYLVSCIDEHGWYDEDGKPIRDKESYIYVALERNIKRIRKDREDAEDDSISFPPEIDPDDLPF